MANEKCFWGLIVKPEKRYEQIVEEGFHISMACVEPGSVGKGVTSVYIDSDNDEFILANLNNGVLSQHLDLNFVTGEKICFRTEGSGTVHLTGYLMPDEEDPMMMQNFDEEDSSEEEDEEVPVLVNGKRKGAALESPSKKPKAMTPLDKLLAEKKSKKNGQQELKDAIKTAEAAKKKLLAEKGKKKPAEEDDDDDDDDDSDDYEDMDEDDEEEDDDSDDDDDDDDDDEEEEEEEKPAPKKEKTPSKKDKKPAEKESPKTPKNDKAANDKAKTPAKTPKRTIKGGIVIEELKVGSGPEAKRGKMLGMFYDGRLATNNKRFDANLKGDPFKFRLGAGEVIKGWDLGLEGIKVGGKRKLTLPPKMAYGTQGAPPDIPPNSTLVFEVECKFVS